jgi:hypothetical protein
MVTGIFLDSAIAFNSAARSSPAVPVPKAAPISTPVPGFGSAEGEFCFS